MIKQADNRAVSVGSISPLHGNCGVQKTAHTGGFLFASAFVLKTFFLLILALTAFIMGA